MYVVDGQPKKTLKSQFKSNKTDRTHFSTPTKKYTYKKSLYFVSTSASIFFTFLISDYYYFIIYFFSIIYFFLYYIFISGTNYK